MSDENKPRFIGPNKVLAVSVEDFKTPGGNDVVKVMYEGDVPPEIMPKRTFEYIVTDVPKDWNYIRETSGNRILQELAAVALEHHLVYGDLTSLAHQLKDKLQTAFHRATNYLWTRDDKQFIPGQATAFEFRSLLEAEQILKSIKPNAESTSKTQELPLS